MIYRLVERGADGEPKARDFANETELDRRYERIGADDCCVDLRFRGLPVFRGLVGPIPDDDGTVARYETPNVFAELTKEWAAPRRRRGRTSVKIGVLGKTSKAESTPRRGAVVR